jgi:GT2 family glycosyltransferase
VPPTLDDAAAQIAALQRVVRALRRRLAFVEGSRFWRLRALWLRVRAHFGRHDPVEPPELPPLDYVEAMDWLEPYARWLLENQPRRAELARMREVAPLLSLRPALAAIVNDCDCDASLALEAIRAQAYPYVRLVRLSEYSGSAEGAARWNAALAAATEDFVVLCEPDDLLAPQAAFELALAVNAATNLVAMYGDRDQQGADGRRMLPRFVPAWSPDTFLSSMYTGRVVFYRRSAVLAAGGMRDGFGSAAHYDLALRVFESEGPIVHRPAVLVHHLRRDGETGGDAAAAARAVEAALMRRGESGQVVPAGIAGVAIVRYDIVRPGRVEVVIPTRDFADYLERALGSVFERNPGALLRVTVVDNDSAAPETFAAFERWKAREPKRFAVVRVEGPFNFSRLINAGVRSTDGPYVLLLNNDAAFLSLGGIEAMLEQAQRPGVGAVGARLLYPDGTLQHAGVVVGIGGYAGHLYRGRLPADPTLDETIGGVRNYSAVTAAAMMFRRDVFEAVGGFDEALSIEFNDLDFCLKLVRAGYRNLCLPHVSLRHEESVSRGTPKTGPERAVRERERSLFRETWATQCFEDPYYNPNLTRADESGALAP